jgi:hypothetical protein
MEEKLQVLSIVVTFKNRYARRTCICAYCTVDVYVVTGFLYLQNSCSC